LKTLLRTLGLSTILACAALSTVGADVVGTCKTTCFRLSPAQITTVTWSATQADCCGGTVNPCPAGLTPRPFSWAPPHGTQQVCRPPA
jgi:hypothetical protein